MGKIKDLTGQRFGRLIPIKYLGIVKHNALWLCKCDCGNYKEVSSQRLLQNLTTSCGCARFKDNAYKNKPEYRTYCSIKARCYNKNTKSYERYGARGIKMSDDWLLSFENFYRDMGAKPNKNYSIERVDVNGDYCKENCIWIENKLQSKNKTNTVFFNYANEKLCMKEFAQKYNINYKAINFYYNHHGKDINKTIEFYKNKGLLK